MLFYRETNAKSGKMYLLATMKYTWRAYLSPPFTSINHYNLLKKNAHNTLTLFIHDFISCFDNHVMLYLTLGRSDFQFIHLLHLIISAARQAWQIDINPKMNQPPKYQEMGYFLFACFLEKPSSNYCLQKTKISRSINDSFAGGGQTIFTNVNLIDKLHTELANWSVV